MKVTPFADDPVRSKRHVALMTDVRMLAEKEHLSTALNDYLLQNSLEATAVRDKIFSTSNCQKYFEMHNSKAIQIDDPKMAETVAILRKKFRHYSSNEFRLLSANCYKGHFYVIDVTFNISHPKIFQQVAVYDSWMPFKSKTKKIQKESRPAECLRQLQLFLSNFCFYDLPHNNKLRKNKQFILKEAVFVNCPQQGNGNDCSLFAIANIVHLAHHIPSNRSL